MGGDILLNKLFVDCSPTKCNHPLCCIANSALCHGKISDSCDNWTK